LQIQFRLSTAGSAAASRFGDDLRRPEVNLARALGGGYCIAASGRVGSRYGCAAAGGHFRQLRRAGGRSAFELLRLDSSGRNFAARSGTRNSRGCRGRKGVAGRIALRRFRTSGRP
jgi:hypothetical protein